MYKQKLSFIITIITGCLTGCVLESLPSNCPAGQHENENGDGTCVSNSKTTVACGFPEVNCLELPGVRFASCEDSVCNASECKIGYHLMPKPDIEDISECVEDTVTFCGETLLNCHDERGVNNVKCENGACIANDCKSNFTLMNGICVSKSVSACGSSKIDCLSEFSHYKNIDCLNDQCTIKSCEVGFHLSKNQCETDSIHKCGEKMIDCQKEMGEFASVFTCHRGKCEAKACKSGFALYNTTCKNDEHRECDKQSDCEYPPMTNASEVKCHEGVCEIVSCKIGYQLNGDFCAEVPYKDNCTDTQECEAQKKDTVDKVICYQGQCINMKCAEGYHFNASYDCEMDTIEACGNGPDNHPVNCLETIDMDFINYVECNQGKCQFL